MHAILLAAGVGKRLGPAADNLPKCLLEVGGKTLLERHLRSFEHCQIREAIVVTGYQEHAVQHVLSNINPSIAVRTVHNADYRQGSIVSLLKGLGDIHHSTLFMDADVVYHPDILRRLRSSSHPNSVIMDTAAQESGEEMMIGVQDARAMAIARSLKGLGNFDVTGESVGFFRICSDDIAKLRQTIEQCIAENGADQEYESALNLFFKDAVFGYETTDNLPWTEIDFAEDLLRARELIATKLQGTLS